MSYIRLDGGNVTFAINIASGQPPQICYWGKRLNDNTQIDQIELLNSSIGGPGVSEICMQPSLAMEAGIGLVDAPLGTAFHRDGLDWAALFKIQNVNNDGQSITIECSDANAQVSLTYIISMATDTGIVTIDSRLTNDGAGKLDVSHLQTATLPVPKTKTDLISFSGRWANEFNVERRPLSKGSWSRENRSGRTSHASFPGFILCDKYTNEMQGEAYALHLAWSGNHKIRVDTLADGRILASAGVNIIAGEIQLESGETYNCPSLICGYSSDGLNELSHNFHTHLNNNILPQEFVGTPRPVHYNCWEAVYFDHDLKQLQKIASKAAKLGVERFVLDDGWFGSRRNDASGLGDWTVSHDVYPDGLHPLVNHIISEGMEMGIWFEPEMVNPDSDLYRAHPDWVLEAKGIDQIPFRNQYVLDISRPEVADYLFGQIDDILSEYPIGYVKWDMNRDHNHPGNHSGKARSLAQADALYALLAKLRKKHPKVEFESCSSGGARIDYGVLRHTDRVWTSDSNDAYDRQNIQRGASHWIPLNIMGAHVGPRDCHITGRVFSMNFRAATAFMGHMGLELNLLEEAEEELATLKDAIALYKAHRGLLHSGRFYRLDMPSAYSGVAVVSNDKAQAIYSIAQIETLQETQPARVYFHGLAENTDYKIDVIWPQPSDGKDKPHLFNSPHLDNGSYIISSDLLMKHGLQLPITFPNMATLLHLTIAR